MGIGCPFFKKVECSFLLSTQSYCIAYSSGKLRVPVLDEEIFFCVDDNKCQTCHTYKTALTNKTNSTSCLLNNNITKLNNSKRSTISD